MGVEMMFKHRFNAHFPIRIEPGWNLHFSVCKNSNLYKYQAYNFG